MQGSGPRFQFNFFEGDASRTAGEHGAVDVPEQAAGGVEEEAWAEAQELSNADAAEVGCFLVFWAMCAIARGRL